MMERKMRRFKQLIPEEAAKNILSSSTRGVLSLVDADGGPYGVPISYVYDGGRHIYFHGAVKGHKIDCIEADSRCSFCVVGQDKIVPEEFTSYFRSVVIKGTIHIATSPDEIIKGLLLLCEKYSPGIDSDAEIAKCLSQVSVLRLDIESMTGKEAIELVQERKGGAAMIQIRKGTVADIDAIMSCYDVARQYMRASGNPSQWINGYPSRELVTEDIAEGVSYVGIDEDGEIIMAFAFIIGDDPTYSVIEDGQWLNNLPYGTIHRLGSTGKHHGILKLCMAFCMSHIGNIRLDTHADNATVQSAAVKLGFTRCGIIHGTDGSPRIAFQKCGS